MQKIDWSMVLSSEDVNECVESFYRIVKDIVATNTALTRKLRTQYPTWFSKPLLQYECEMQREIKALDINKGAGPDGLPSLQINTIGDELINPLHVKQELFLMPGKWHTSYLFINMVTNVVVPITDR
ncbi:hypothetical protein EVAR_93964_1 [Eumeta japonica]|uniref:Uncharacterized protein n=1 Tax=Eumeta variegata TaxID=151549 RepID=A0A4C1TP78_EUMVA|nr:hypothetical protein EVAR_93964_1 [Eumeta japonica]